MRATYNYCIFRLYRKEHNYNEEMKRKQGIVNESLDLREEGKSSEEICKHLGISRQTLSRMKKDVFSYEKMVKFPKTISSNVNEKSSGNNEKKGKKLTKEEFRNRMLKKNES